MERKRLLSSSSGQKHQVMPDSSFSLASHIYSATLWGWPPLQNALCQNLNPSSPFAVAALGWASRLPPKQSFKNINQIVWFLLLALKPSGCLPFHPEHKAKMLQWPIHSCRSSHTLSKHISHITDLLTAPATLLFTIARPAQGAPTPGPLSGRLFSWTSVWLTFPSPGHRQNNCLSSRPTLFPSVLLVLHLFQISFLCPIF